MNRMTRGLAIVGALTLTGCNVTTANSTQAGNVAADNVAADNGTVDAGTMAEQAAALGATTDQNAATDNANGRAMSNDMTANDASPVSREE